MSPPGLPGHFLQLKIALKEEVKNGPYYLVLYEDWTGPKLLRFIDQIFPTRSVRLWLLTSHDWLPQNKYVTCYMAKLAGAPVLTRSR